MAGNPLITFPALDQTLTWSSDNLFRLLLYMTDIAELVLKRKGMAFLADFQKGYSEEKMALLVQALQSLEVNIEIYILITNALISLLRHTWCDAIPRFFSFTCRTAPSVYTSRL